MNKPTASARSFYLALAAAFALLFLDFQFRITEPLQYALNQSLVLPARRVLGLPANLYGYIEDNFALYSGLLRDNQRLRALNSELTLRLIELDALHQENRDMRESLGHEPSLPSRFARARVVQMLYRQNRAVLVIDRSADDGIRLDQAVLDRHGLLGRIISTSPASSHVQMISDSEHYLSSYTEGGIHTIVRGRGLGSDLMAMYIPNFADVEAGEEIFSSGLDGIYPPRFPIGRVSSVEHDPRGDFSRVMVRPHARLQSSRELYVLLDPPAPAEPEPEEPDTVSDDS